MLTKTIEDVDVKGRRVLMRVDFNVPMDDGSVTDDHRIREALATIESVRSRGGRVVLMSHLGRPSGSGYEPEYSLKPVAERLSSLLDGAEVAFPDTDCTSELSMKAVDSMQDGDVVLLENLRFHAGETKNDSTFASKLARYGDVYCNDAFGAAHRDHASMVGVPKAMEGKPRVAGLLLKKELDYFSKVQESPESPFVAVLGGAKVSDKLGVIDKLMNATDVVLVGGAMAYTFLAALGKEVGGSRIESGMLKEAERIIDHAAASKTDLILPVDHVCGKEITRQTPVKVFKDAIESGWKGFDIGPESTALFTSKLDRAKTIVWNGPMGVFECDPFDVGTRQIAEAIVRATSRGATSVIGGGDTASAVHQFGLADQLSHVSTGGGASLELMEGRHFTSVALLDA